MKYILSLVLVCLLVPLALRHAAAQDRSSSGMSAPNALYVELGGKGLLYGFYYERLIVPQVGVSAGFSTWNVSLFSSTSVTIVPVFVSWYSPGEWAHLYVDGGLDIVSVTASFEEFGTLSGHGVIPFLGAGFCSRSSGGGFYFKAGPLLLLAPGKAQPWGNLSLGFTF